MTESINELEGLNGIPVTVVGVQFKGAERTKGDLLETIVQPCLKARTFGELTQALAIVGNQLGRLDIFKEMRFVIDRPDSEEDGLVVRVEVKERKYRMHAGTEIQKNEVGFGAGATIYNIFGRAERLDVNAALGSQSATPLSLNVSKPVNGDPDKLLNFSVFSTLQHYINGANYKNRLQGFSTFYSFTLPSLGTKHELKYSLDWRHIFGISEDASVTVRRSAGHSLKSSLTSTITKCTRDCNVLPTRGYFTRLSTEFAGLGGSVAFLRNDLTTQLHLPLYKQLCVNAGFRLGTIAPLIGHKLGIIDKYQMGGPLSIRGFALNSLGPMDRSDAIGGDVSVEASLGLSFPLSNGTSHMLRGHFFANTGILTNLDHTRTLQSNLKTISEATPNVSIGGGLQVKLGDAAKLEMNVAYPFSMQPGAIFHRGLQVGLGVEFL